MNEDLYEKLSGKSFSQVHNNALGTEDFLNQHHNSIKDARKTTDELLLEAKIERLELQNALLEKTNTILKVVSFLAIFGFSMLVSLVMSGFFKG